MNSQLIPSELLGKDFNQVQRSLPLIQASLYVSPINQVHAYFVDCGIQLVFQSRQATTGFHSTAAPSNIEIGKLVAIAYFTVLESSFREVWHGPLPYGLVPEMKKSEVVDLLGSPNILRPSRYSNFTGSQVPECLIYRVDAVVLAISLGGANGIISRITLGSEDKYS